MQGIERRMVGNLVRHESLAWKIKNCRGQTWKKEFLSNLESKIYGGRKGFEIGKIKRIPEERFYLARIGRVNYKRNWSRQDHL